MKNEFLITRACGKIYIAGEYAAVHGKTAIIAPVSKYLTIKISESTDYSLKSHKYHKDFIKLDLNNQNEETKYIIETLNWFNQFLIELNKDIIPIQIEINSELDNEENKKLGLGSSAAVIIGLLRALFTFYDIGFDYFFLYKSGVMIHSRITTDTSFGDLACISFERIVLYQKFDNSLFDLFDKLPISDIINSSWPGLKIEALDLDLEFIITYTNKPAISSLLVSKVNEFNKSTEFQEFLSRSEELVLKITKSRENIIDIISALDHNLRRLDKLSSANLITPEMDNIRDIIESYGGVMKFSGAGGGDCVICFFNNSIDMKHAKTELIKNNYYSIDFLSKEDKK